jgi:hypothetical protein
MGAIDRRPSAGAELACTMADACAEMGEYRQALAHLDALRSAPDPVPAEYERKQAIWARRVRSGGGSAPRSRLRSLELDPRA